MKKIILIFFAVLLFSFSFIVVSGGQTTNSSSQDGKQDSKNQQPDQQVKIKSKPRVEIGNCEQAVGMVRLKVTFDQSAEITNVETVKSSDCDSFDRAAIKAAKEIKFKPAVKDGQPITITLNIEYKFSSY